MNPNATLFLTVLSDGKVDVTFHHHTKTGRVRRVGQRFMMAPWDQVLKTFAPDPTVRVIVRQGV